ncbi:MAG: hypothetical protein IPG74_07355 [Flavobacteriales bacterium]|nr:hypothetical protein [Flavobacteriales bacterium]
MLSEDISQRNLNFESYRERITNFSNEFELGLFLYIVRRSAIWIAICILLAVAAAYLYLRYTANTFESRALLQFEQSNTAQQVLKVTQFGEDQNLTADVELLHSRFFLLRALKRMPMEVSYFNKGNILTMELYTSSPFILEDIEVQDARILTCPSSLPQRATGRQP